MKAHVKIENEQGEIFEGTISLTKIENSQKASEKTATPKSTHKNEEPNKTTPYVQFRGQDPFLWKTYREKLEWKSKQMGF